MNKAQLVDVMAAESGMTKLATKRAMAAFISQVGKALQNGERVKLAGFGAFETKSCAARTARNPKTNETVSIPPCKKVTFKSGKALKLSL